jgi:TonB-linked SusC/RagA family outer membrane protein
MKNAVTKYLSYVGSLFLVLLLPAIMHAQGEDIKTIVSVFYPVEEYGSQIPELEQKLDFEIIDKSISEALFLISKNFRLEIAFDSNQLRDIDKTITLDQGTMSVADALVYMLEDTGFKAVLTNMGEIILKSSVEEEIFQENVTGRVTDLVTEEPIPGVNIVIAETSVGTTTNQEGYFELNVPSLEEVLIFSFIGYERQEISLNGRTEISVQLVSQAIEGEEMVVTAFGIQRESRQLSYAVQDIDGEAVASVGNSNIVNSLQGKIAGVTVKQTSGAPGSSHRITIRGTRSLLGDNEPLYVIDGLPVSGGSRAIDINPSNIESINVLKGPTAAALYGLRASNGAIVIETKKGTGIPDTGPQVSFESNYNIHQISMLPEKQSMYMQGENGQFNPFSAHSWGPRVDETGTYINQLGEEEEAAIYDNARNYFQTGGIVNSNLNISNSLDRGNYALGLGYTDQSGIMKTTGMQRLNVSVSGGYDLFDDLRISTSMNLVNTQIDDQPTSGTSGWWAVFAVPRSYDLAGKPTHVPGNPYQQINFRGQHDNLYWLLDNNYIDNETSRFLGNLNFTYTPLDWLAVDYRVGMDGYTNRVETVFELGSGSGRTDPPSGGSLNNFMQEYRQVNSNLMATITQDISEDFNIELTFGNEFYHTRARNVTSSGSDFVIGGFHHISNAATHSTAGNLTQSRVVGFYGNLSLSWQNSIFLNATGRNDIVSNMPSQNRSFFYPSIGLSAIFTDFLSIPENILSLGKIRASIAEVGQAGPIHSTQLVYNSGAATGGFAWPYQGLNAFSLSGQLNSDDLRTENTRTYEVGVDLRFLGGRLGLDYTYYDSKADGQIYRVPIALSTGFSNELRNAGEMSVQGHEIMFHITPIATSNIMWDITTNFTTFTNKVLSLAEGIDQLELGGFRVTQVAIPGEEYPAIRGSGFARDPASGEVVVDAREILPNGNPNPTYGMPLRAEHDIILGNSNPDFEVGFVNNFSYRNLSLTAQIDWRQGGKFSSGQNRLGKLYGVNIETANREEDYIYPGKKGYFESGELIVTGENDITIQRGQTFFQSNQDPIAESNVYDATYVRLREVRISYALPSVWLDNLGIRSASVYLIGTNLWTRASVPHFDPEMFNNTASEQYNSYPQTKGFGGGIRIDI